MVDNYDSPSREMKDKKLHAVVARRCGAKQIWKSKDTKHSSVGALLKLEMLKKCTALWREHDTTLHPTLDYTTLHYTILHYTLHHSTRHDTTGHDTTLHYADTTLHYMTLHLHCFTLHDSTLHHATLQLHNHNYNYTYTTTTQSQLQLHLHYNYMTATTTTTLRYSYYYTRLYNYTTLQLPHTTLHDATLHCTASNHLAIHQWIRSAIFASHPLL